jgi:hypothetical protein
VKSAAGHFPWDELLDLITADQSTVPILGPELSTLPAHGSAIFEEYAARQLAERHGLQLGQITRFERLLPAFSKAQLSRELSLLHRELLGSLDEDTLPAPLEFLAGIRDFPLFVTTAPDALLAATIRIVRERDAGPLVATLNGKTDLPRNWAQGPRPTLFHLFGRINAVPDFALTEEDTLEFLHRMQSEAHRPEQLFDELRTRHLLLLGLRLPDWALRFFLRVLHGDRLSEDTGQTIVLAGDAVGHDSTLIDFLRETGRRIWIYEEGSAAEFTFELSKRWHATQDEGWSTTSDGQTAIPTEPADMAPGAVYLSAARADRTAAERLATLLDEAGLDVWFDRNEVQDGPHYERRIHQHLQQCDLFLPLLSPETETQTDAFFRKEWQWALECDEATRDGKFVVPVWVGADRAPASTPPPFHRHSLQIAPGGQATAQLLRECVEAVREARID